MKSMRSAIARVGSLLWILGASIAVGLERPQPGMLESYQADGTLTQRLERARQFGNHRVRPDVARRTSLKLQKLAAPAKAGVVEVPPAWEGMPTTGTNKVLVFLIDFPDANALEPAVTVSNKVFGAGDMIEYPLESLQKYYQRSSYSNLYLTGSVAGWYRMSHTRSWYTNTYGDGNLGNAMIINEVASAYDGAIDYSQFDNNHDGSIDYFAVIWAGAPGDWSSFWWGYQWNISSTNIVKDGVKFDSFSWQWETIDYPSGSYTADTIIHETGHALGLPDYYDYNDTVGPDGGVGGLDMMDGTYGDHNAFSKFMLDWVTPVVITNAQIGQVLRATGQYPDAALVMNCYTNGTPFAEYFMVQNRYRVNNDDDVNMPGDGLLVWHVDARLNAEGTDFLYDNSYADHKLLRLMEADGFEDIGAGYNADATDYYRAGAAFSPLTTPNSARYDGTATDVTLDSISADGLSMTCNLSGVPPAMFVMEAPATLVSETSGVARLSVVRSQVTNSSSTIGYYTSNGTAVAGADYVATNGVLSFSAGQTTGTVHVTILNDSLDQPDQGFMVCLSNVVSGTSVGTPGQTLVVIASDPMDDSTPPRPYQVLALDSNTLQVVFNERLDWASAGERTNYTLSASVPVYASVPAAMQVMLGIGGLTNGTYTLTVNGVKDAAGNKMVTPVATNFSWPQAEMNLWLKLDENSGLVSADSSGKGHAAVLENGTLWTTGQWAGGVAVDGINDQVRVPDFNYGPELTVSFWFRCSNNSGSTFQYMLSHGTPQAVNNVNIYLTESEQAMPNLIRTSVLDADDPVDSATIYSLDIQLAGFPDDTWHLYTLTVKSNEGARVYLDGRFKVGNAALGGAVLNPATALYLGGRTDSDPNRYFNGKLDDVRLYNRALSSNEVAALCNCPPVAVFIEPQSITPCLQWESIPFSGFGVDPEGDPCKLVWWSDVAGYLGTGISASNSSLPAGVQPVRLMAFDSYAARGDTSGVVAVVADTDTNGLPDAWATTYWPSGNSGGATNDSDHDGSSNFEEWLTGTNPTNGQSAFRIMDLVIDPDSGTSFDWVGLAGRRYALYTSTNLMNGFIPWTNNLRPVVDGILSATNAIPPGESQRYYRIQVSR